ncbi:MAG: DNA mismatch repair protein MutT [Eubacterium sp.]
MKEETGLTIINPELCGIKQFPIENGRYIVFLFKTNEFAGDLVSSDEGRMEWIKRSDLNLYPTVNDLEKLLSVMESGNLTEFQYVIEDGDWKVSII